MCLQGSSLHSIYLSIENRTKSPIVLSQQTKPGFYLCDRQMRVTGEVFDMRSSISKMSRWVKSGLLHIKHTKWSLIIAVKQLHTGVNWTCSWGLRLSPSCLHQSRDSEILALLSIRHQRTICQTEILLYLENILKEWVVAPQVVVSATVKKTDRVYSACAVVCELPIDHLEIFFLNIFHFTISIEQRHILKINEVLWKKLKQSQGDLDRCFRSRKYIAHSNLLYWQVQLNSQTNRWIRPYVRKCQPQ